MKRKSNQRITKIKRDKILELLEHAESISVQSATTIQPLGSDLVPYPDMDRLRLWTNKYLLSGVNKIYPTKIDEQGNMYLTTIVDGLPLHTKMTKSISGLSEVTSKAINTKVLTTYGEPTFNQETGIISGFSASNYFKINPTYVAVGTEFCLCIIAGDTSLSTLQRITWSYGMLQLNQQGTYIATWDDGGGTNEKRIASNLTTGQEIFVKLQYTDSNTATVKYSLDGVDYTTVYENFNSPRNWGSTDENSNIFYIGTSILNSSMSAQYFHGSINLSKSYVRLPSGLPEYLALDSSETITVSRETSKPGLWLSNLILPMNGDNNGYYLRHNKVHSNESSFDTFNSDTVGNYSFTFLQRAKIAEQDACNWVQNGCDVDFHADIFQRMYNMHFVPDRQSCVVYPSLQLWTPLFGRVYSTYQTIVTPSDPDMQFYQESNSKCLNFTNRLYSNNDELLDYSMKLVGKDWSYQFRVYGNGNGSGNDYGNGDHPENDNGSNGACVEGTITYKDSTSNTTCTQEINSCFQTDQSLFNPDLPNLDPNSKPLNNSEAIMTTIYFNWYCDGYAHIYDNTNIDWETFNKIPMPCAGRIKGNLNKWCEAPNDFGFTDSEGNIIGKVTKEANISTKSNYFTGIRATCASTSGCPSSFGGGEATLSSIPQPQTGVDIYLNIYDLKAEAEDQGLPWTGGCGEARFTVEFSTSKCNRPGCTSRLIASNVDINSLGDISKFNNITITG